ncbi:hypothetical protein PFMC_02630 [Plasmodium falciparum CAMP/Malaysia]|uniref:Uncharacterized protein n=1 Tax=Plasmodium falciparum (isolate Camp / Malaysia) TaxID=5835 RepID=A0A024X7T6_PLAFC|nr:hypothetical protein PFMC_02630 [Plasmodium falciparum CAMP/Malaysia]
MKYSIHGIVFLDHLFYNITLYFFPNNFLLNPFYNLIKYLYHCYKANTLYLLKIYVYLYMCMSIYVCPKYHIHNKKQKYIYICNISLQLRKTK